MLAMDCSLPSLAKVVPKVKGEQVCHRVQRQRVGAVGNKLVEAFLALGNRCRHPSLENTATAHRRRLPELLTARSS